MVAGTPAVALITLTLLAASACAGGANQDSPVPSATPSAGLPSPTTSAVPSPTQAPTPTPTPEPQSLEGSWQVDLTGQDLLDAGAPANDMDAGTYTWTFEAGRATIHLKYEDGSVIMCAGDAQLAGDVVNIAFDEFGTCGDEKDSIRWAVGADGLHLTLLKTSAPFAQNKAFLEAKTWQPKQSVAPPSNGSSPFPNLGDHMFTIGGHDLFVHCAGSGSPAVILIHGLGGSHQVWGKVEPVLSEDNLVCSFDRVNAGNSSKDSARHTITQSAAELGDFLAVVGIPTPVVLVAASYGGEIAIMYAGLHPEMVSGIVLVDAVLPIEDELTPIDPAVTSIPQITAELDNNPERADFYEAYAESAAVVDNLPDVPITYMQALHDDWPNWPAGIALYDQLLHKFVADLPQGRLVDVDSGHDIQWEKPASVIDETRLVLAAIE